MSIHPHNDSWSLTMSHHKELLSEIEFLGIILMLQGVPPNNLFIETTSLGLIFKGSKSRFPHNYGNKSS